jgi:hypothetical protein
VSADYHGLPTPRTTLRTGYLEGLLWCKGGCRHQAPADPQKLVDTGRGDVLLISESQSRPSADGAGASWTSPAMLPPST